MHPGIRLYPDACAFTRSFCLFGVTGTFARIIHAVQCRMTKVTMSVTVVVSRLCMFYSTQWFYYSVVWLVWIATSNTIYEHMTVCALPYVAVSSTFDYVGSKITTNPNIFVLFIRVRRPGDRNLRDAELISCRLRRVEPLCRLPGSALQQLAMCGFYEDLEKGVTRKFTYIYISCVLCTEEYDIFRMLCIYWYIFMVDIIYFVYLPLEHP